MNSLTTFAATALVLFSIGQALVAPAKSEEARAGMVVAKVQALVLPQAQDVGYRGGR